VAGLIAIVALDLTNCVRLHLLLRAVLGGMADLVAVAALGETSINDFTGILETLNVLFDVLGPEIALTRARRVPLEPVRHGILFGEMALQVHVGQGRREALLLDCNEPQRDILSTESALKFRVSRLGGRLDIDLDRFLDIVNVTLLGSALDQLPGLFSGHVFEVATVNLASALTLAHSVS
jgi:hypothetical protein